jgi:hypothetical protein
MPPSRGLSWEIPAAQGAEADSRAFDRSGIGLETSILFAKEGANVLLSDVSQPALDKAVAKVKQLVPNAGRVETKVLLQPPPPHSI